MKKNAGRLSTASVFLKTERRLSTASVFLKTERCSFANNLTNYYQLLN